MSHPSTTDLNREVKQLQARIARNPADVAAREALADALLSLGRLPIAAEHLFVAADRLAEAGDYRRGIGILRRLLSVVPDHANGQLLLTRYFMKAPRAPITLGRNADIGQRLFRLPEQSAYVLSQVLPLDTEDPEAIGPEIQVPIPPEPEAPVRPLLRTLDRELWRDRELEPNLSKGGDDLGLKSRLSRGLSKELDDTFELRVDESDRISPAALEISCESLPPNPIIDHLNSVRINELLDRVDLLHYGPGKAVIDHWTDTRCLYIVVAGTLNVVREADGQAIIVDRLDPGEFFGEFEVLTLMRSDARVETATEVTLLELPEGVVERLMRVHPEVQEQLWGAFFRRAYHSILATSDLLRGLPVNALHAIAYELEPQRYEAGDLILRTGQTPKGLYAVIGGSIAVIHPEPLGPRLVARLAPGDFFGVVSSASRLPVTSTVVAAEPTTLAWLPLGPLEAIRHLQPEFDHVLKQAGAGRAWKFHLTPRAQQ